MNSSNQSNSISVQQMSNTLPTSPMSKRYLSFVTRPQSHETTESYGEQEVDEDRIQQVINSDSIIFDTSNVSISIDKSDDQHLSNHPSNQPPPLSIPFDNDIPSWIPSGERRYWTQAKPQTNVAEKDDEHDGEKSLSLFKWCVPSDWRMFRFLRKVKENPLSPNPKGCSSARRSFRAKGKASFWGQWKNPEDRMSVDRIAYNAAIQSPTGNHPPIPNTPEKSTVKPGVPNDLAQPTSNTTLPGIHIPPVVQFEQDISFTSLEKNCCLTKKTLESLD